MTIADDFREIDLTCLNFTCPQCDPFAKECGAPDKEVCLGRGEDKLDPCKDRKV